MEHVDKPEALLGAREASRIYQGYRKELAWEQLIQVRTRSLLSRLRRNGHTCKAWMLGPSLPAHEGRVRPDHLAKHLTPDDG